MKVTTNQDKELVEEIRRKLKEKGGHCPCRLDETDDTRCMCKEFREKMVRGESGYCHCGLYYIDNEKGDAQ